MTPQAERFEFRLIADSLDNSGQPGNVPMNRTCGNTATCVFPSPHSCRAVRLLLRCQPTDKTRVQRRAGFGFETAERFGQKKSGVSG
jgi:hypothetical protein